ncbi:MAG TPA: T9SS type A sorting domain-containing protein [Flavobacteriales bacterium]|nr:T9SS type A sorting domain-containing protein [Flavobacteriales bacterium]
MQAFNIKLKELLTNSILKNIVNIIIPIFILAGLFNAKAQVINTNGTKLVIQSGTTISVVKLLSNPQGAEIDNSGTLKVGGNLNNSGTLTNQTGSLVELNGTTQQSITGANDYYKLKINNTAGGNAISINSGVQKIWHTLTLSDGIFNVNGDSLILLSNATSTARIAEVTGGDIAGNFTIQRYIDGNDGWRMLASPVSGTTIADWNNEFMMSGFTGTDAPNSSFTSVAPYDETVYGTSDYGYVDPTHTSNTLVSGKGYFCWVGDGPTNPIIKTIDLTGGLTKGTQAINVTYTDDPSVGDTEDGWNLIGNPFPSDIYWDNVALSGNLTRYAYIYDDATSSYVTLDNQSLGTGIASHQAFWVKVSSGSNGTETITIEEQDKAPDGNNFLKTSGNHDQLKLRLSGNGFTNSTRILFEQGATENYDWQYDAFKLLSLNANAPNLSSISADAIDLSINYVPDEFDNYCIPIRVLVGISGTYTLTAEELPIMPINTCLILEDLLTGETTDLLSDSTYTFAITNDTYAPRFVIRSCANTCLLSSGKNLALNHPNDKIDIIRKESDVWVTFNLDKPVKATIYVYNLVGQKIIEESAIVGKKTVKITLPEHPFAIYVLTVVAGKNVLTKKIVFEN